MVLVYQPHKKMSHLKPAIPIEYDLEFSLDIVLLNAVRNVKDRLFVLKVEHECAVMISDERFSFSILGLFFIGLTYICDSVGHGRRIEYIGCNSYHRLLIHRIAQMYNMVHFVDSQRQAVIVQKTPHSTM